MNKAEKFGIQHKTVAPKQQITQTDIANIGQYMLDKNMSAIISLGNVKDKKFTMLASPGNKSSDVFCLHSVGKVFTGMLIFKMLGEGIISESDLDSPIQLNEEVLKELALHHPKVLQRLNSKEVTLHKIMTHMAGLGNFLDNYDKDIKRRDKAKLPQIKSMHELLQFVDEDIRDVNKWHYSNTGILLVGFALEHAYEKKYGQQLDYNALLQKYLISKIGLPSFALNTPESTPQHEVKYNPLVPISPKFIGSSAGGSWINIEDFAKFGQWIYNEYHSPDSKLGEFLQKYGQEFYDTETQVINHYGGNALASSYLAVSLKTGDLLTILSKSPADMIQELQEASGIFYKPKMEPEQKPEPSSSSSTTKTSVTKNNEPKTTAPTMR